MKTWGLGYEKSKEKAKKIYKNIGIVLSPALGGVEVIFSSIGFTHLLRKGRIPRARNEQKKRFVLLEYVESIVRNPEAKIIYREQERKIEINRHGEKLFKTSKIHFWTFVDKIEDCNVKVVVSQINGSKKHFFSVMGDNIVNSKKLKKASK